MLKIEGESKIMGLRIGFGKRIAFREQFINYWNANIKDKNRLINEESY